MTSFFNGQFIDDAHVYYHDKYEWLLQALTDLKNDLDKSKNIDEKSLIKADMYEAIDDLKNLIECL